MICALHGKIREGFEVACPRGFCTSAMREWEVKDVHACGRRLHQDWYLSDLVMLKTSLFILNCDSGLCLAPAAYAEEVGACSCTSDHAVLASLCKMTIERKLGADLPDLSSQSIVQCS